MGDTFDDFWASPTEIRVLLKKKKVRNIIRQAFGLYDYFLNEQEIYVKSTDNEFKTKCNQHMSPFKLEDKKKNDKKFSEHIWKLKSSKYAIL